MYPKHAGSQAESEETWDPALTLPGAGVLEGLRIGEERNHQ